MSRRLNPLARRVATDFLSGLDEFVVGRVREICEQIDGVDEGELQDRPLSLRLAPSIARPIGMP